MTSHNILVVDDDPFMLELLSGKLAAYSFNISTAHDINSALNVIKSEEIDCAILDVMLGSESGHDLANKIKSIAPIPILFMTAEVGYDVVNKSFLSQGMDFIPKPFDMNDMLSKVKMLSYLGKIDRLIHKMNKER